MRTLIIIVSVTLCMHLGGLTVILVVDVVSEIREFSVYYAEFSCKRSVALWLFFYSDMEPLSKYSPATLHRFPATRILNEKTELLFLVLFYQIMAFTIQSKYPSSILTTQSAYLHVFLSPKMDLDNPVFKSKPLSLKKNCGLKKLDWILDSSKNGFYPYSYIYRKKIPQSDPQAAEVQLSEKKKERFRVKLKTTGTSFNHVVSIHCETNTPKGNVSKMIGLSKSIVKLQEPYKCPKSNPIWLVMENAGHYCLMFKLAYITLSHKSGNNYLIIEQYYCANVFPQ